MIFREERAQGIWMNGGYGRQGEWGKMYVHVSSGLALDPAE